MALPQQLKTARMTNATLGSTIDDNFGAFESALADILGFTVNVDITASPFTFDNAGRITKALVQQRGAGPVGWRFRDTTAHREFRIVVNGANMQIDENTVGAGIDETGEAAPAWTTRLSMVLSSGQLTGTAFSSARMGLAPQGDGNAAHYLDGTGAYSAPATAAFPSCRVRHSLAQNATSGAFQVLSFDTEDFDTDTMHDTVTNNQRITFTTAGKYRVIGQIAWASNGTGYREATIRRNGSTDIGMNRILPPSAAVCAQTVTAIYNMGAGDYVELYARQNSGSTLAISAASSYSPIFSAYKIG